MDTRRQHDRLDIHCPARPAYNEPLLQVCCGQRVGTEVLLKALSVLIFSLLHLIMSSPPSP